MGNPRIVRSNAPEVVILNSKPTVTGQDKAKELAAIAKKNRGKTDWAKWITSTGGGLLGYSLASSFLDDKTYEEKRKESVWSKVLRELASIGVGAAGAYGGYLLGKKAATNDVNAVSAPAREGYNDPLWDPSGKNWVLREDATGDGPYVDLFGEKRDAASAWKWPWYGLSAGSAAGAIASGWHGARRTGEWLRGGEPKQVIGKDGVVVNEVNPENSIKMRNLKGEVSKIDSALAEDAAKTKIHEEELRRISDKNTQLKKEHLADQKALLRKHDADMQRFYREEVAYNNRMKAWEKNPKKSKMPNAPKMPHSPTFRDFVPLETPTAPKLSGYTARSLTNAKSNLKRALGRRAAGGWLGAIVSSLTSLLTARQGYKNWKEEDRVDDELRAAGIDPSSVKLD